MKRQIPIILLTLASAAGSAGAYASESTQNDALGIADAKVSLTQAVSAAERHVGGQAARAEYENDDGQPVFEVEVVKGSTVMDVKVDPTSGAVIAATGDQADHEEDEDRERDE